MQRPLTRLHTSRGRADKQQCKRVLILDATWAFWLQDKGQTRHRTAPYCRNPHDVGTETVSAKDLLPTCAYQHMSCVAIPRVSRPWGSGALAFRWISRRVGCWYPGCAWTLCLVASLPSERGQRGGAGGGCLRLIASPPLRHLGPTASLETARAGKAAQASEHTEPITTSVVPILFVVSGGAACIALSAGDSSPTRLCLQDSYTAYRN